MESSGIPGRIQVTETTMKLLETQFEFEPRGPVEIKGKGSMETFLLVRQKVEATRVSIGDIAKRASRPPSES
jgi:class 3 adenylate cyclase